MEISGLTNFNTGHPWWLSSKESACNARDASLIPGSGISPGGGHGNLLQYSCWENPMNRGTWWVMVHGVTSWTWLKQLSTHTCNFNISHSEREVAHSCSTLCDRSLRGFSVHGIFQARVLEWIAISFSRGIFLTQGSNLHLLRCRQTLYPRSHLRIFLVIVENSRYEVLIPWP